MFGNRYFGKRYFGDRYFGTGGTLVAEQGATPGYMRHFDYELFESERERELEVEKQKLERHIQKENLQLKKKKAYEISQEIEDILNEISDREAQKEALVEDAKRDDYEAISVLLEAEKAENQRIIEILKAVINQQNAIKQLINTIKNK